jgi:hypothetical protein
MSNQLSRASVVLVPKMEGLDFNSRTNSGIIWRIELQDRHATELQYFIVFYSFQPSYTFSVALCNTIYSNKSGKTHHGVMFKVGTVGCESLKVFLLSTKLFKTGRKLDKKGLFSQP